MTFLRACVQICLQFCAAFLVVYCPQHIVKAESTSPILVSTPTSTRAIALDTFTLTSEPFFARPSFFGYGSDKSSTIILFAVNLSLKTGEDANAITADAEDVTHRHYTFKVEYVGKVPGQEWLTQLNLALDKDIGDVGDVLIRITYQGVNSNRVRVGIGHVGGGLEDDAGAAPTPAPPYTIRGRIMSGTAGLGGVSVVLSGAQITTVTGDDGSYGFSMTKVDNYAVTPSKKFYTFNPPSYPFNNFSGNQTANFSASLVTFTISGTVKDDQGAGLDSVSVTLKSSAGQSASRTITTGIGGVFSFTDVPATYSYEIIPFDTLLVAFTSQSISELDRDAALIFSGTLRTYTIRGTVANRSLVGTSGVSVTLSGPFNMSTTTDANGNYSFSNLPAGKNYNVAVAKTDYVFSPESRTYHLLKDEEADFIGIRFYRINGRVTDNSGKGVFGIRMSLDGPETGLVITGNDGAYSFTVTSTGDYTVIPSKQQDFYQFSPSSRNFNGLSDHQSANFIRTFSVTSPTFVLEFDGTPMSVDYGVFWPQDTNLGKFFWEFWAMPGNDSYARYMLSDGYGGAHALLFGFNYGPRGYNLMGNIWDGSKTVYFSSDEGPSPGEWGHYAVGWDGKNIITYYDGVPVGKQPFLGPRVSTGVYNGSTMLLIGGSTHQNFNGRIAQVHGYEENNPRERSPESPFAPQTVFSEDGQLLSYYFRPAERVADLSNGYNGVEHIGWLRGMLGFYFDYSCPGCPIPRFVIDPTAPDFLNPSQSPQIKTLVTSPPPTPGGARVFDSFSRDNSTYILGGRGGLGTTESGTAGTKTWQTNQDVAQPQPFGILGGRAVLLMDDAAVAWISTGAITGNLDIRVDRTSGAFGSGLNTGLCFRVTDKNNFFFAYTSDDETDASKPRKLSLGYYQSGIKTVLASGITMPSDSWRTLRVVTTQSGDITIYAENVPVYSTNSLVNVLAAGAGLYNNAPGMGLTDRWDNFTVRYLP